MELDAGLKKIGSRLVLRQGRAADALAAVVRDSGATAVCLNRLWEPLPEARDADIARDLEKKGVAVRAFNGSLLFNPHAVKTQGGKAFQVFTPFWRACLEMPPPRAPRAAPKKLAAPARWPASDDLERWTLEPAIDWAGGFRDAWSPGEAGAQARLRTFRLNGRGYDRRRDVPSDEGTSRFSPHLHFGELSPVEAWHALEKDPALEPATVSAFRRELAWRDFAHYLLVHFPRTTDHPLRPAFEKFPWKNDAALLRAWRKGRTGYPIVDAGLRELWKTGWMHNRVRMIVASFLVKDLLLSWKEGARWFWETLVDADLANNTLGWQWAAGCGADAAPFFRIFNPSLQGEKFDPEGAYVRRWVPELARVPGRWIHRPWQAPPAELARAGVRLGETYPGPVVDHAAAREAALRAFRSIGPRKVTAK